VADTLYVDIETRATVDLRKTNVYRYTEDPHFSILMAAWAVNDTPVQVAVGTQAVQAAIGHLLRDSTVRKVAHNAQFERVCFSRFIGYPTGQYLHPRQWDDTAARAAVHGYPRKLDLLAHALGGEKKDVAGTLLINWWCKPDPKTGQFRRPEDHPAKWEAFVEYCRQDVVVLREVDRKLPEWPSSMERLVWQADQLINDRGMAMDMELAQAAVNAVQVNAARMRQEITLLTGVENPTSHPQFSAWVKEQRLPLPDLKSTTVEKALSGNLTAVQRRALELRLDLALTASKKYGAAMAEVSSDGRVRGGFRYHGAHTGRWAGRGVQLHNLPRHAFKDELEEDLAILNLKLGRGASPDALKRLVRPLFTGPFTVVDYSAIEARVVAWLAGEQWVLDAFAGGRDIYVETAQRIFGVSLDQARTVYRPAGKVAVLALGYNGGTKSMRAMTGGDICVKDGPHGCAMDEEDAAATFDREHHSARGSGDRDAGTVARAVQAAQEAGHFHVADLRLIVDQWREANGAIVGLWKDLERAFLTGGTVGDHLVVEAPEEDVRILRLPSGRGITYREVQFKWVTDKWDRRRRRASYLDPVQGTRTATYGGKLVENATQAVARDVLAEALVRLHRQGLPVVAHVHDEVIVESTDMNAVHAAVVQPPRWAEGLPIGGDGFITERYRKG